MIKKKFTREYHTCPIDTETTGPIMITLRLSGAEATTIMVALRELQERIDRLSPELRELTEGELLDEAGIDELCHKMRPLFSGERVGAALR